MSEIINEDQSQDQLRFLSQLCNDRGTVKTFDVSYKDTITALEDNPICVLLYFTNPNLNISKPHQSKLLTGCLQFLLSEQNKNDEKLTHIYNRAQALMKLVALRRKYFYYPDPSTLVYSNILRNNNMLMTKFKEFLYEAFKKRVYDINMYDWIMDTFPEYLYDEVFTNSIKHLTIEEKIKSIEFYHISQQYNAKENDIAAIQQYNSRRIISGPNNLENAPFIEPIIFGNQVQGQGQGQNNQNRIPQQYLDLTFPILVNDRPLRLNRQQATSQRPTSGQSFIPSFRQTSIFGNGIVQSPH